MATHAPTTQELERDLSRALDKFKRAADELLTAWNRLDEGHIENYPTYLPSFDEFTADLSSAYVRPVPVVVPASAGA